jgi:hypothetical protein
LLLARGLKLKDPLKRGITSLKQLFKDADSDEIVAKMKASELLLALRPLGLLTGLADPALWR